MIIPFVPIFLAILIMMAQQQHDRCRGHARGHVEVAWSHAPSSVSPQRPRKPAARCDMGIGTKTWKLAGPARAVKPAAPDADAAPQSGVATQPTSDKTEADSGKQRIRLVTAATAVAEQITAARAASQPPQSPKTTVAPAKHTGPLVVLLLAHADIKTVPDLAGKHIAIDRKLAAFKNDVQAAIATAGAADVKLSGSPPKAINRLMGEKVPAAVLALVSPEAADSFPEVEGFTTFRFPLPSR